jgi:hypothetical protein
LLEDFGRSDHVTTGKAEDLDLAAALYREDSHSITQICETLRISKGTVSTYLRHEGIQIGRSDSDANRPGNLDLSSSDPGGNRLDVSKIID